MEPVLTLRVGSPTGGVAWSNDGTRLAAYSDFGRTVTLWRSDGQQIGTLRRALSYSGNSLAFLAGGDHLVTPTADDSGQREDVALTVWDLLVRAPVRDIAGPAPGRPVQYNRALAFAVSSNGEEIAAVTSPLPGQPVTLYRSTEWARPGALALPSTDSALCVTFAPDGRTIAVGTVQGRVLLFDAQQPDRVLTTIVAFQAPPTIGVESLAFSPDGRLLATGGGLAVGTSTSGEPMSPVKIWSASGGKQLAAYPGSYLPVRELSWSPGGHVVAAAAGDRSLRLLAIEEAGIAGAADTVTLPGSVAGARFSPDGRHIATASGDAVLVFELPR